MIPRDRVDLNQPDTASLTPNAASSQNPVQAAFWTRLERCAHEHDLFHVLRWLDARSATNKRLGRAKTPRHEPVRIKQLPHMVFAPSTVAAAQAPQSGQPAQLSIFNFGLFGPNGPLPLHMTEYARERLIHHGDGTMVGFADMLHHRLALLFYRAWANAQSTTSLDHADEEFSRHLAALMHDRYAGQTSDSIANHAGYAMAGHLLRQTRNPEGLLQILSNYFGVRVRLHEFQPRWVRLHADDQLRLNAGKAKLEAGAVLGVAVRDAQHAFRLELGPLSLKQYRQFLPGNKQAMQLRDWVRRYVGWEFMWDVRLVLRSDEVRGVVLGEPTPLGQASWLGRRSSQQGHADDFILTPESSGRKSSAKTAH